VRGKNDGSFFYLIEYLCSLLPLCISQASPKATKYIRVFPPIIFYVFCVFFFFFFPCLFVSLPFSSPSTPGFACSILIFRGCWCCCRSCFLSVMRDVSEMLQRGPRPDSLQSLPRLNRKLRRLPHHNAKQTRHDCHHSLAGNPSATAFSSRDQAKLG
jgi:hypothetical protein